MCVRSSIRHPPPAVPKSPCDMFISVVAAAAAACQMVRQGRCILLRPLKLPQVGTSKFARTVSRWAEISSVIRTLIRNMPARRHDCKLPRRPRSTRSPKITISYLSDIGRNALARPTRCRAIRYAKI